MTKRRREIGAQPGPQTTFLATTADIAIYGGSAGGGKMLALHTSIATPYGWTSMGDLSVGDVVLSDEGLPTRVTWVSDVEHEPDAWELLFDDGSRLVADAEHQWVTLDEQDRLRLLRSTPEWKAARRARRALRGTGKRPDLAARNSASATPRHVALNPRGSVRTTRDIVATLVGTAGRAMHCIVNPLPLSLPHAELPIDPYVLGVWLGDGTSREGAITSADEEIVNAVRARGYQVTRVQSAQYAYTVHGLTTQLRTFGLANNKHVPQRYLRASFAQRLALLQGLCDTDGYACPTKGSVEFTTTSPALREGMLELLATLGIKPSCRPGVAKLNGRETGPKWRIQFWTELPSFELSRKLARQRRDNGNGRRSRRYIVDARSVPAAPMRCIGVDAPSHCYLAGRQMIVTHNSWALAYDAARYTTVPGYAAAIFRRTSPELTGGGSIWEESQKLYPHIGGRPREHPTLDWRFPSGARVEFKHAVHEHSVKDQQSKQYSFLGLDELTHFTSFQFWYLLSRLRSQCAAPKRLRATCNPDPDSFVRALIDWYIGEDGLAIESRSGVIRWFVRLDERLIWARSPDELCALEPHRVRRLNEPPRGPDDVRPQPMSFTFIRARASDNKILLEKDPTYIARLNLLPGAEAKRLRDGNWDARNAPGDYFDRSWCKVVDSVPEKNVVRRVRWWDKAATSPSSENPDPDYTRGIRLAQLDSGLYLVEDLASLRAGPAHVDELMLQTAQMDGLSVDVGAWIDPGQAGKVDEMHMQTLLLGFPFQGIAARENKETYAKVWTGLAKSGRLIFLRREYLPELFGELEGFPLRTHDDCMDALSGAFQRLIGPAFSVGYEAAPDPRHPTRLRDAWDDDDDDDGDYAPAGGGGYF